MIFAFISGALVFGIGIMVGAAIMQMANQNDKDRRG